MALKGLLFNDFEVSTNFSAVKPIREVAKCDTQGKRFAHFFLRFALCKTTSDPIETLRQAQGKRFAHFLRGFAFKKWLSAYIFRLYCPPTENKALVICPSEQYLQASINASKIFSLFTDLCCKSFNNSATMV